MPACPTCGFVLTIKEWNLGQCTACASPVKDLSKARDPIAAAEGTGDLVLPAESRPGWGTVRTGLLLVIAAIALFWIGIGLWYTVGEEAEGVSRRLSMPAAATLRTLSGIGMLVSAVLAPAGAMLCGAVPGKFSFRLWGWGTCVLPMLWIVSIFFTDHLQNVNRYAEFRAARRGGNIDALSDPREEPGRAPNRKPRLPYSKETIKLMGHVKWSLAALSVSMFVILIWRLAAFLNGKLLAWNCLLNAVLITLGVATLWIISLGDEPVSMFDLVQRLIIEPNDRPLWRIGVAFLLCCWLVVSTCLVQYRISQMLRTEQPA